MMIQPSSAGDPSQAAAAVARAPQSSTAAAAATSADDASPDVVVTLSQPGAAPGTYNASGKMAGGPSLSDMGANAPDSLAKASESAGDDGSKADAASATTGANAGVDVDEEATAAA